MPTRDASVEVELDADQPVVFTPSDTVTGTVCVEVYQDVACDGLTVDCHWESRGRGEVDTGIGDETTLFEGSWEAGDSHAYTFELTLTPGPYTYRGEQLDLRWVVEANADLTMMVSSGDSVEFDLQPGHGEEYLDGTGEQSPSVRSTDPVSNTFQLLALIFGLGLLSITTFMLVVPPDVHGARARAVWVIFGSFGALGVVLTGWALRRALATVWIGDMDLSVADREVTPGERLTSRLTIEPTAGGVTLDGVTFRLHGYEEITTSGGSSGSATVLRESIYNKELPAPEASSMALEGHTETEYEVEFEMPETDAYSFETFDTAVHWEIQVHVEAARWLDWKHSVPLRLRPAPTRW